MSLHLVLLLGGLAGAVLAIAAAASLHFRAQARAARAEAGVAAQREQFLRGVLNSMGEGVAVFDAEQRLITANARLSQLFGYSGGPGDSVLHTGDSFPDFLRRLAERGEFGDCDVDALVRVRQARANRQQPYTFEHVRPNGTVLEVRNSPLPDGGFVRIYSDVTARKRAEAKLRQNERRFRDFASVGADWFWETDLEQRFTYHSGSSLLQGPGLFESDIIGCSRPQVMATIGADPDPTPEITSAMANGEPFHNVEYRFRLPDGGERWVRFSGVPVREANGKLVAYRGTGRDVTARKAAERALREKEKRYRSIFENAVEGLYQTDTDGRYVQVNPALARMLGCEGPEDVLAHVRDASDVYVDPTARERVLERVRSQGSVQDVNGKAYRKDGSTFRFTESTWAVYDDTGKLAGYEGLIEDTTEQQRAEFALKASEQRYRTISEMTSDMVYAYSVDDDGELELEWVAGSLAGGVGLDPQIGPSRVCWASTVHPDDRARLEGRVDRLLAGESIVDEFRIIDAQGETRWIRLHSRAEFDPDTGKPQRILGAASDINDRKQAETQLRQTAALLGHATKLANLGHWMLDDTSGRMNYVSEEVAAMLGMTVAEAQRQYSDLETFLSCVHPDDRARYRDTVRRGRAEGRAYDLEFRFLTRQGELRHAHEVAEPVLDENGRVLRTVGTLQDITEIKQSETELRRAKESAELANRAKTEFLANMSHELRTPLNAIMGFAEILEQEVFGEIGPRNRSYAADIRESGAHLLEIINDILDVAKAEAGAIELAEQEMSLDECLESCFRLIRDKAKRSGLHLGQELPEGPIRLFADPLRMKQVLINLISNAVKFTPEGGSVTVSASYEPDGALLVQVQDTGIGIPATKLATVMEPFSQADAGINRAHEGTGLGLPLARALAEYHGGRLWLESQPGLGTCAKVWLPAERVLTPSAAAESALDSVHAKVVSVSGDVRAREPRPAPTADAPHTPCGASEAAARRRTGEASGTAGEVEAMHVRMPQRRSMG